MLLAFSRLAFAYLVLVLLLDFFLDLLPLDAKRRIGEHVVELGVLVALFGKGISLDDVLGVLALDHHVAFADGVGLGVQFLPEHFQLRVAVQLAQVFLGDGKHPAHPAAGFFVSVRSSSMKSRSTIWRMTSRGVKCSPAVSFDDSANFLISSSKTDPIRWFGTVSGCRSTSAKRATT
jgi:hypothetical protein